MSALSTLGDFSKRAFTFDGIERSVYEAGTGPGIILMPEIPGITPEAIAFASRLADEGYRVSLPALFGDDGAPKSALTLAKSLGSVCIRREFHIFKARGTSPVTRWLRALARDVHAQVGGPGIGVIGMCFTGNFALAMAVEPAVLAPVMSQPSLPLSLSAEGRAGLHISDADLSCIRKRGATEGLRGLAFRFTRDPFVRPERFAALRRELPETIALTEIDSSPGNAWGFNRTAHSVLTHEFIDKEGHPTREALDAVLALFESALRPKTTA